MDQAANRPTKKASSRRSPRRRGFGVGGGALRAPGGGPSEELPEAEASSEAAPGIPSPDSVPIAPPPPKRRFLARVGSAALYISDTDRPWELPVDALVIPPQLEIEPSSSGQVAEAVRKKLPSSTWDGFLSQVQAPSVILSAEAPVFIDLDGPPPGFRPRTLIVATSWVGGEEAQGQAGRWPVVDTSSTVDGAARATRAVVREAARRSLKCLAIPLLGAGAGNLQPVAVAKAVLTAIQSAQPRSPLQEITILTLQKEAYDEAVALFSRVPQGFSNDLASGEDLLEVASEVQALTDVLLLRSMEPPLAVGDPGWMGDRQVVRHGLDAAPRSAHPQLACRFCECLERRRPRGSIRRAHLSHSFRCLDLRQVEPLGEPDADHFSSRLIGRTSGQKRHVFRYLFLAMQLSPSEQETPKR